MEEEISFSDFMEWLKGGGFDLPAFRKARNSKKPFSLCGECVMACYLREKVSPSVEGCGNTVYFLDSGSSRDLPPWAIKVVAKFDQNYLIWSPKKMIEELQKAGENI